jgi:Lipoprotein LpqB beta-propeller domain/Sporulation and spore germination
MAAEKWSSEGPVSIYRGSVIATGMTTVKLEGRLVGSLAPDRTYTAVDQPLNWKFELLQEDGEWRIDKPPPGLMVAEYSFKSFYQTYDLYFLGNGSSLVPDPIYLPALSNPANVASALMKALLHGPSKWLKPAVSSAIPPNTGLSVDSVTITDGIAEVQLSDSVSALPDPQRSLLAAQIVYTLKQVGGVRGVMIKVNQQPYRVPGADPNSFTISVDAIPGDIDPVPFGSGDQVFAVHKGVVNQVSMTGEAPALKPIAGQLGVKAYGVDTLAVSVTGTDLAVSSDRRTTLRRAPVADGQPSTLLTGVSDLLRPQFTRYGEIWAIGKQGGRQRMWMFAAEKSAELPAKLLRTPIDSPVLRNNNVTAFKISPDGTRMALVRRTGAGSELGLARITRSEKITVDEWRPLKTTQSNMPQIGRIADVGWLDATELLVLGAADVNGAPAPFRVAEDASRIALEGEPASWGNDAELTVLTRMQTAIVVDIDGHTWKYNGSQWLPFAKENLSTIAYPG